MKEQVVKNSKIFLKERKKKVREAAMPENKDWTVKTIKIW